jgi:membrane protease YdiL (CAAX protease family)
MGANPKSSDSTAEVQRWPLQSALGAVLAVVLSTSTAAFPAINRLTGADISWFPVPMLAVGLIAVWLTEPSNASEVRHNWIALLALSIAAVVALTASALYLTGWSSVNAGVAMLDGDSVDAPVRFRTIFSLTSLFVAGLTEEASIRGVIQFPLTKRLGSLRAQIIAGAVFILLHVFSRSEANEYVFVTLAAIVYGQLAAASRSVWLPAAVHALTNTSIACVTLILRP